MSTKNSFTGRTRHRRSRRGVRIADRVAHALIATGGIGTVIAVSMVFVFLVWVVVPLFLPATISPPRSVEVSPQFAAARYLGVDEYRSLAWSLSPTGSMKTVRLDTGAIVAERELFPDNPPTASALAVGGREAACGFADGSVRLVKLGFATTFPAAADLPEELREAKLAEPAALGDGLLSRTKQGQLRLQAVKVSVGDAVIPAGGAAIRLVDCSSRPTGRVCAYLDAENHLVVHAVSRRQSLLKQVTESSEVDAKLPFEPRDVAPAYLLLAGQADNLYLIWEDGHLLRYDIRDLTRPRLAEQIDLLTEADVKITALQFLAGKTTFVVGDSTGRVRAWFPTKPAEARTKDGMVLVAAHDYEGTSASAVTALASSSRGRQLLVAQQDGTISLLQATTGRILVQTKDAAAAPFTLAAIAPKADSLVLVDADAVVEWNVSLGYPEASLASLFRPVWYESYDAPSNVWQSTGGGDDFEPKLGLAPLVFGTIKATCYSLLFAVPLALASAIYTSEFLHARIKARIKPAIEMMASLPSVVLGFVAAIVVAPFVEQVIPAVLAALFVIPCTFLLVAYFWQLLPQRANLLLVRWRFAFICATLPLGIFFSAMLGPLVEQLVFGGNLHAWLDRQTGSGVGGWVVLLLPVSAVATAVFLSRRVNPSLRHAVRGAGRGTRAIIELVKFVVAAACTVGISLLIALLLDSLHLDPRGLVLQTYVQRNALVVGFVMGFAIIPLIYTIADDALSTVPSHLRSASLGAGATPWQTAVRVIIPTAMSGLFSAVMIGLGRAVGETMIVLMAAGNTPIMDWNIFNGFETLSASIATELPEAVQGSTHYRTLFVAALALFAMTFVVNTIAEVVRLRFRRRAHEL